MREVTPLFGQLLKGSLVGSLSGINQCGKCVLCCHAVMSGDSVWFDENSRSELLLRKTAQSEMHRCCSY